MSTGQLWEIQGQSNGLQDGMQNATALMESWDGVPLPHDPPLDSHNHQVLREVPIPIVLDGPDEGLK